MGIDQFPSPFKVKPIIKKQNSETRVQSEINTPNKSAVTEKSSIITSLDSATRQQDLLSWIDDLDSRMKRTLSSQYHEFIKLKNQTNIEDLREKYKQIPFDDSFRKLGSILDKRNEIGDRIEGPNEATKSDSDEDDLMNISKNEETKDESEIESEEQSDDDIIEIVSSEEKEVSYSDESSEAYENHDKYENRNIDNLHSQGVTYHLKNGRPRLSDHYMNSNKAHEEDLSEYSSDHTKVNDDDVDMDEPDTVEFDDEDEEKHEDGGDLDDGQEQDEEDSDLDEHKYKEEYENENEHEGEYDYQNEERNDENESTDTEMKISNDSENEVIILDSDEEDTYRNNEKNINSEEDTESKLHDSIRNESDYEDDLGDNEIHQEYSEAKNHSIMSSIYPNHFEERNADESDEGNLLSDRNLMGLAEAVLKESNEITDDKSFVTAHDPDSLYHDDKFGIPQKSTNLNSGYAADYDTTDVNYQPGNLSGIEEENKEMADTAVDAPESFFKEETYSSDSIQLVDDFENISDGSLADEERDYEDSYNNNKANISDKCEVYEKAGPSEMKTSEVTDPDDYSIEVEYANEVPIFKTVAEEDPETVLLKLKEAESKFNIRLNSVKLLEDEIISKNGHLPESYMSNKFIDDGERYMSNIDIDGRKELANYGTIPKPIPKPLLYNLPTLDDTTIPEDTEEGDEKDNSISSPILETLYGEQTSMGETNDIDDTNIENTSEKNYSSDISQRDSKGSQIDKKMTNDRSEIKNEVFSTSGLGLIDDEIKSYHVNYKREQGLAHDLEVEPVHVQDDVDANNSQINSTAFNGLEEEIKMHVDAPALAQIDIDQSKINDSVVSDTGSEHGKSVNFPVLDQIDADETGTNDTTDKIESESKDKTFNHFQRTDSKCHTLKSEEKSRKSINLPMLEQINTDESIVDDTTINDNTKNDVTINKMEIEQDKISPNHALISVMEHNKSLSNSNDETVDKLGEENKESVNVPTLEQIEDTTMNETVEENDTPINAPILDRIDVDQSKIDDTTMNETVEENETPINAPILDRIDVDQSKIDDTTMNETVEENEAPINAPILDRIDAGESKIDDTTINETVEENDTPINAPILDRIDVDQSKIDDTTMNETVEENETPINAPILDQLDADQSKIEDTMKDTTINKMEIEQDESLSNDASASVIERNVSQSDSNDMTIDKLDKVNKESVNVPTLEQIEDTTMNETVEENDTPINAPILDRIDADESKIDDSTMNEIENELKKSSSEDASSSDSKQIEPNDPTVETLNEIPNDNKTLLGSSIEGIERIQEVDNALSSQFNKSSREMSISEMLYPSVTQELNDIDRDNDNMNESEGFGKKEDINTKADLYKKSNAEVKSQHVEGEKYSSDEVLVNEAEENYDLNKDDSKADVSDENGGKQSFTYNNIVIEEPKEADENAITEYEQTTYVNVMGDGILHPSNIMEPDEQESVVLPNYCEQIEIVTGPSEFDDIEVLEPSTIIEPNDSDANLVELINSAFEQGYEHEYEVIEPTDVWEPLSRSQTPFRKHDGLENLKEKLDNNNQEESRKRSRDSEGFVSSKLRKLITKPFQWLTKNRKLSSKIPTHIEVPKLRPLDDNLNISPQKKNPQKSLKDLELQGGIDRNTKKYEELILHLKKSIDSKSNEIGKDKLHNISDSEREESNLNDFKVDDEDKHHHDTRTDNNSDITSTDKVEENAFEEDQRDHEGRFEMDGSDSSPTSSHSLPITNSEIDDSTSPKNIVSTNQRSTDKKSNPKHPKKILGLDMSEVHMEPIRSLRSGHKYGLEENDDIRTSDLLSSPKKTRRPAKELPKLHINKQRHLSNTKVLNNSSPTEVDSKQSSPSSRKSSGSKWIETSLDHPALRTRSKSPLKRSIHQISSDLEEDPNLPRRSRRIRRDSKKLNNDSDNEKTEREEVKRGRPKKRH